MRRLHSTAHERISYVSIWTSTNWGVVSHSADRLETASPAARVHTLVVPTSLMGRTVRVQNTLRLASNVRITKVLWIALTNSGISLSLTVGVGSAGRARVSGWGWFPNYDSLTTSERVTFVAWQTLTDWCVIDNSALRIVATSPSTRVSTLLLDAGVDAGALIVGNTLRPAVWWGPNIAGVTCTCGSGA